MSNFSIFCNSTFFPWSQKMKKCRFNIFAIRHFFLSTKIISLGSSYRIHKIRPLTRCYRCCVEVVRDSIGGGAVCGAGDGAGRAGRAVGARQYALQRWLSGRQGGVHRKVNGKKTLWKWSLDVEQAWRGGAGEAGPDVLQPHPVRLPLAGLRTGRAAAWQPGGAGQLSCGSNWPDIWILLKLVFAVSLLFT